MNGGCRPRPSGMGLLSVGPRRDKADKTLNALVPCGTPMQFSLYGLGRLVPCEGKVASVFVDNLGSRDCRSDEGKTPRWQGVTKVTEVTGVTGVTSGLVQRTSDFLATLV